LTPVSDLELSVTGSTKELTLAEKVILQGYTPSWDDPKIYKNKRLAPVLSRSKFLNINEDKRAGFDRSSSKAVLYKRYETSKTDKWKPKRTNFNWLKK